jgi:hypothetical protein
MYTIDNVINKLISIFHENTRLNAAFTDVMPKVLPLGINPFVKKSKLLSEADAMSQISLVLHADYEFPQIKNRFIPWVMAYYSERFTPEEMEELAGLRDSYLDFLEVIQIEPGKGIRVHSIINENTFFLQDKSFSNACAIYDIIMTRVYSIKENYYAIGTMTRLERQDIPSIQKEIGNRWEKHQTKHPKETYKEFSKTHWSNYFTVANRVFMRANTPKVPTPELAFFDVLFMIQDFQLALQLLENEPEFHRKDMGESLTKSSAPGQIYSHFYEWTNKEMAASKNRPISEPKSSSQTAKQDTLLNQTIMGACFVNQKELRFETFSKELAEFIRFHYGKVFAGAAKFRRVFKLKIEKSKEEFIDSTINEAINPEYIKALEMDLHTRALNEKIPMLNDKTPLEARKDPFMKPALIEWVKGLKNHLERTKAIYRDEIMEYILDILNLKL